ncbi:MAG: hypothetical protein GAK28_02629 [Luteibacter sp.]|nr:MAG: hypothetical protein GAK28_02629 [Luteibacter sp.]
MRIPALSGASREGTLFFHFGGPGLHPRDFLPELRRRWSSYDADDALHGGKRLLA